MNATIPMIARRATIPITTPTIQIMLAFFFRTVGIYVGVLTAGTVTVGRTVKPVSVAVFCQYS